MVRPKTLFQPLGTQTWCTNPLDRSLNKKSPASHVATAKILRVKMGCDQQV